MIGKVFSCDSKCGVPFCKLEQRVWKDYRLWRGGVAKTSTSQMKCTFLGVSVVLPDLEGRIEKMEFLARDHDELGEPFGSGFKPEFMTIFRTACGAATSSILFLRPQFCGWRRIKAPTAPR